MERSKNEAEAYANDVIPRARGEAAKILQAAKLTKRRLLQRLKRKQVDLYQFTMSTKSKTSNTRKNVFRNNGTSACGY